MSYDMSLGQDILTMSLRCGMLAILIMGSVKSMG